MDQINEGTLDYNQCQTAIRRLHEYLSHELSPEEVTAVDHHLGLCQGCFARFHFEEALLHAIKARVHEVHAPEAMRARVLTELHALEPSEPDGEPAPTTVNELRIQ